MVIALIVGLIGLCMSGLYVLEGAFTMVFLWGAIGICCMAIYLVSFVKKKLKDE